MIHKQHHIVFAVQLMTCRVWWLQTAERSMFIKYATQIIASMLKFRLNTRAECMQVVFTCGNENKRNTYYGETETIHIIENWYSGFWILDYGGSTDNQIPRATVKWASRRQKGWANDSYDQFGAKIRLFARSYFEPSSSSTISYKTSNV